ncbi:MAG: glycosyltransferase family 4 protein [Anaerohalosphaeraceae bacterium]|nr:glycosyltransferase family 4 protein [Anaerohalosphaeraceae bacterium]
MKLALFFTFGVSLKQWYDSGLLDREKLLYERLIDCGTVEKVFWLTYGTDDTRLAEKLKSQSKLHNSIEVVPMSFGFNSFGGKFAYSILLPLLKRKILKQADVLKTNQASGSWAAALAKKIYKRPLIFRTGYTWSRLKESQKTSKFKLWFIKAVEKFAYKNSDIAIITTETQAEYIAKKYSVEPDKIKIIPNYIDTNIFKPDDSAEKCSDKLIYIGRLSSEKNLFNLIAAASLCDKELDIYGSGSLEGELKSYAETMSCSVNFKGTVPNGQIPELLNRYQYFILASEAESMPKSLIEATACGLICIGTDVTGINEVITDGFNGYLADGTDAESIAEAIRRAFTADNSRIKANAVIGAKNKFSIDAVVNSYIKLIPKLIFCR